MISAAAAPSLSGQALPAVTVPSSRKAGFSEASRSTVESARGPSSFSMTVPSASVTGAISRAKNPSFCAATARSCERCAYASWS